MHYTDIHQHFLPKRYMEVLSKAGIVSGMEIVSGIICPSWHEHEMLAIMDQFSIEKAYLSVSSGVYYSNEKDTLYLAKLCNESSAELLQRYPNRLGAFASLPIPFIDTAIKEMLYSLDELQLTGVMLQSNYGGLYLGHPGLDPLYAELDKRGAVVLIHPTLPAGHIKQPKIPLAMLEKIPQGIKRKIAQKKRDRLPLKNMPVSMLEFVFDTTRSVMDLIYSGYIDKYPNIKFIIAHAGGTLPYLQERLAIFEQDITPQMLDDVSHAAEYYLKQFYYDVALSTTPATLRCLCDTLPTEHIVYGSDFPFVSVNTVARGIHALLAFFEDQPDLLEKIAYGNAEKLLTRAAS